MVPFIPGVPGLRRLAQEGLFGRGPLPRPSPGSLGKPEAQGGGHGHPQGDPLPGGAGTPSGLPPQGNGLAGVDALQEARSARGFLLLRGPPLHGRSGL